MAYPGIPESEVLDLMNSTIPYREKLKFSAPQKYTDHPILNKALLKGMTLKGGTSAEKKVVIKASGRAGFTQLYATKEYAHVDVLKTAKANWAHLTTDWMYDRREGLMNRDAEQIVDLMMITRLASESDMANVFEEAAWQTIISEADEFGSFRGIPYWISKGTTDGYNGVSTIDRSGNVITTCGNINGNTVGNEYWANWAQTYTNYIDLWAAGTITTDTLEEDALPLLSAMNITYEMTNFKAPRTVKDLEAHNPLGNYTIYCDTKSKIAFNTMLRFQNQGAVNFGFDMGKFNGNPAFMGTPIEKVPQLDTYAAAAITGLHPFYFVNHNELETMVLRGNDFYEHPAMLLPDSGGNVGVVNVDLSCQLMCGDRRKQGLVYTS